MKMLRYAFAALALFTAPANAQWQTPAHSVPIGEGGGNIGFNNAAPSTAGQPLVSNGASADPTFQVVPNAGLANAPASTAKCNPTGGPAAVQDCTAAQMVTLGLAPAAFINSFAVNHTIAPTDCGGLVQMGSGSTWPLTLTLPASPLSNGFTAPCNIGVVGQASRGVKLSGFSGLGLVSSNILWPTKSFSIAIANSGWALTAADGRWGKQNLVLNVDSGGNDSNDGLATGIANAIQTLNGCRVIAQSYVDTMSQGNGGVTCLAPAGQLFKEFVQVFFPLVGGGSLIFQGNGGQFNWAAADNLYSLQFGDLGVVGITNVNFTTAGSIAPSGLVAGHNYGIIDFNAGVSFTAVSPAVAKAVTCDLDTHFNVNSGFTYTGSFTSFVFDACLGSTWDINNALTAGASTSFGRWANIHSGAKVVLQGNMTFPGTPTGSVALLTGNAVLQNLSGATPPGGAPTGTSGGQYCVSPC